MTNHHSLPTPVRRATMLCVAVLACGAIAGCFGGGGGDDAPPVADVAQEVPASVADSTTAYTAYAQQLAPNDMQEALSLDLVATAPTSEVDEPAVLE